MLIESPAAIIATDINLWANTATQRTAVANQASLVLALIALTQLTGIHRHCQLQLD